MNENHKACGSAEWAAMVREQIIPWALGGHVLGDDVDDAFLALQPAAAIKQRGPECDAAKPFERLGPEDQIGDPGLVLDRDKDDAVGAARALADEDEPGNRDAPLDRQGGECSGGDDAPLREIAAQKGERVAFQAEAGAAVVLDDVFAEGH